MSAEQWLVLRLDLLPSIAQEVEQICTHYIHLCDEVRKGNKQAYQDLIVLQARIRGRMDDFDKFYDRNYADYRIGYFEKMKLRLRKLISPHIDVNRLIYEETQNYNQQSSPIKNTTPPPVKDNQQNVQKVTEFVQAQPKRPQSPPNKMINSSNYNSTNKQKQATPIAQNNKKASKQPQQVKTSQAKAKTQQDELVFTIKMSKEEYLQYIQAKQKQR
ncbi:unnamed protein product (macronuclear) [Paramecium tetraurelia]|uniref:Uncharacterized protein n=1 Tax=Paramecium tetraurelia TaxID=5888 RepID=A0CDZ8_PARTE|nr:uncharacterized protein GSPATT00007227001 [Paramecium tetraurelia]CAK69015.1 unnamed protein product [Paramecium tetraurelia]|eukprot:XP_001436412.1 hypothetical protein (macronuclear) [Paramecium tetraurelia strain d4-2]